MPTPRPSGPAGTPARRWLSALAAAALLSGCATLGDPSGPCDTGLGPRIGVPAPQCSVADFQFNGATREPSPSASFPQASSIRVVVTDANPFLYAYQVEAKNQRVSEPSITDFFSFAFGINLPKTAARTQPSGAAPPVAPGAAPLAAPAPVCTNTAMEEAFMARVSTAQAEHTAISDAFETIEGEAEQADQDLKVHSAVYLHPEREAPEVQAAALQAVQVHDDFEATIGPMHRGLEQLVPAWTATVAALNADGADIARSPSCPEVVEAVKEAALLVADTAAFRSNVAAVGTLRDRSKTERGRLHSTANDRSRFYHTVILERYDAPTDVTVIVRRRTLAPKDTFHHVASQRINVGGRARFSLSAGLGWTQLGTTTYGVARRFVTPVGGTSDTVNAVVVAKENSDHQIFPMVTFNTRLTRSTWRAHLQLVLGVGLSRQDGKALPGYLLGLGVDSFGQRLLVTGGLFLGEEHRLGGGLRVGDRVPGSEATIPMERRMVGKLGVALTYRLPLP